MSISRNVYLYCDVEECLWNKEPIFDPPDETAKVARAEARTIGWVRRNGRDLCTEHAQQKGLEG